MEEQEDNYKAAIEGHEDDRAGSVRNSKNEFYKLKREENRKRFDENKSKNKESEGREENKSRFKKFLEQFIP
ncbi:MAG: hypothetical protein MHMPM18_003822 [Marteilia pararefringens]